MRVWFKFRVHDDRASLRVESVALRLPARHAPLDSHILYSFV